MRLLLAIGSLLVAASVHAQALPEAGVQTGQSYELKATVHPAEHRVEGEGEIVWVNNSGAPQPELFLHTYLNAFADDESVFMRESGGQLRGVRFQGHGAIELHELTLDGTDLLAGADDEVVSGDHTQLRVPLPRPVASGAAITLHVKFTSTLPPVFARSGYHGDFHMVAQWFPKVARLEPDGTWASFPYHGVGEFYADFAQYTLEVSTPADWEVFATGVKTDERMEGERVIRRFEATRVHDTAFATAPWFQEREQTYRRPDGSEVKVTIAYPPGFGPSIDRHWSVAEDGLRHFGRVLGEYPYPQLTIVVPPRGADGAAGMEYPTLFVSGGPWFAFGGAPMAIHEELTAHELGHQWFQGMVATNEVRWPALDEGLTEWITGDLLRSRHGDARSGLKLPLAMDGFEIRRSWAMLGKTVPPPPARPVTAFRTSTLGRSVYARTSVILETIARTWGRDRIHRALGRYARQQRFKHPGPDELMEAFAHEYGEWMPRRILRPALFHGAFNALHLRSVRTHQDGERWSTTVVAERDGELPIPVQIELIGSEGQRRRLDWPGDLRRLEQTVDGHWIGAIADPDHHSLLDYSRLDDALRAPAHPPTAPSTLFGRALYVLQTLFAELGP